MSRDKPYSPRKILQMSARFLIDCSQRQHSPAGWFTHSLPKTISELFSMPAAVLRTCSGVSEQRRHMMTRSVDYASEWGTQPSQCPEGLLLTLSCYCAFLLVAKSARDINGYERQSHTLDQVTWTLDSYWPEFQELCQLLAEWPWTTYRTSLVPINQVWNWDDNAFLIRLSWKLYEILHVKNIAQIKSNYWELLLLSVLHKGPKSRWDWKTKACVALYGLL